MKNYYAILQVPETAEEQEIRKAYRRLAKKYHPDVVKDDENKIKRMYEIQEAYQCLGDEEKRKQYDEMLCKSRKGNSTNEQSTNKQNQARERKSTPDMGEFERFFGFQPGKGMETYQGSQKAARKPDGPIRSDEMFRAFFGFQGTKGGGRK